MKKYSQFNQLTPAQSERFALLAEGMGAAIQTIGKILLHGYEHEPSQEYDSTNREFLEHHLGNVKHAIDLLCNSNDINGDRIQEQSDRQARTIKVFLHHQGDAA